MGDHSSRMNEATRVRLVGRARRMAESGRISEDEARRLQAAADPAAFDAVVIAIRARHAGVRLDGAVADGTLSPETAADVLRRLREGEDPAMLDGDLRHLRRPARRGGPPAADPADGDAGRAARGE